MKIFKITIALVLLLASLLSITACSEKKADMVTVSVSEASLPAGEWLYLSDDINTIMSNKMLSFSCNIDGTLGDSETIIVGHGYREYASSYVEITGTHVKVYQYYNETNNTVKEHEHGLTIENTVKLTVSMGVGNADITLEAAGGKYQVSDTWAGRNGKIYASSVDCDVSNAELVWGCDGYNSDIWLYGDSYFNLVNGARWTSYMIKDGYTEHMLSGYPGMGTQTALEQFKIDIAYGSPKFVVWCMGMNNGDQDKDTVNQKWLEATEEFIAICNENGVTPILTTVPSTPTTFNFAKSDWVKDSGYRYIDFERAVDGDECDESLIGTVYKLPSGATATNVTGNEWRKNMLDSDLVHPAQLGARALYNQVLRDFPEIKENK